LKPFCKRVSSERNRWVGFRWEEKPTERASKLYAKGSQLLSQRLGHWDFPLSPLLIGLGSPQNRVGLEVDIVPSELTE
jgi:hypothetical protein